MNEVVMMEEIMRKTAFTLIVVLMGLAVPAASMAGYHHGSCGMMKQTWDMDELDADMNGMLSFEEYLEPHMERFRGSFKMIDTDQDGAISDAKWQALGRAHGMPTE
jgi:hypothetical protein